MYADAMEGCLISKFLNLFPNLKGLALRGYITSCFSALSRLNSLEALKCDVVESSFLMSLNLPNLKYLKIEFYCPFYSTEIWEKFGETHPNLEKLSLYISKHAKLDSAILEISIIIENLKFFKKLKSFQLELACVYDPVIEENIEMGIRISTDERVLVVDTNFPQHCPEDFAKAKEYFPNCEVKIQEE